MKFKTFLISTVLCGLAGYWIAGTEFVGYDPDGTTVLFGSDEGTPNDVIRKFTGVLTSLIPLASIIIRLFFPKAKPFFDKILQIFNLKKEEIEISPLEMILDQLSDVFNKLRAFGIETQCDEFCTKLDDLQEHANSLLVKKAKRQMQAVENAKKEKVVEDIAKVVQKERIDEAKQSNSTN